MSESEKGACFNLIIGLAGPYGSGCSSFTDDIAKIGNDWPGCIVEIIDVSKIIEENYEIITGSPFERVNNRPSNVRKTQQSAGTKLRTEDIELVGKLIVMDIYNRGRKLAEDEKLGGIGTVIFVIDSLKNCGELEVLRRIYQDEFYFCFIHSDKETRWRRMNDYKSWKEEEEKDFHDRDEIDNDEKKILSDVGDAGQQVGKLAAHADYYVVNNTNRQELSKEGYRFLSLLLGEEISQPTNDERCMHLAFSSANSSGCLSRQVGAAIFTPQGNVLAVGHNDVPSAGGGLYSIEKLNDRRCFKVGDRRCVNDINKEERFKRLSDQICDDIEDDIKIDELGIKEKVLSAVNKSEFKEATEYCRAVHAEMAAILSVSRNSSGTTIGSTMYVTTQPCHNCTKHIICAGIKKVVYIEPYPKSLGKELHSDAIILDPQNESCSEEKVIFVPYQGVAPIRFHNFFKMTKERKDSKGIMLQIQKITWANEPKFAKKLTKRSRESKDNPITFAECVILDGLSKYFTKQEEGNHAAKSS